MEAVNRSSFCARRGEYRGLRQRFHFPASLSAAAGHLLIVSVCFSAFSSWYLSVSIVYLLFKAFIHQWFDPCEFFHRLQVVYKP